MFVTAISRNKSPLFSGQQATLDLKNKFQEIPINKVNQLNLIKFNIWSMDCSDIVYIHSQLNVTAIFFA